MFGNPNKRIRLDPMQDDEENAINEDLWGQDDDITAEEFDMLEIQATQSCVNQNFNHCGNLQNTISHKQYSLNDENDVKQLQYELEGRIKLLSQSFEKSVKELNEERLHRERLIRERIKEFSDREANLKKEVEKMQSILEFKDQEMKSTYCKFQMMKSQLPVGKSGSAEKVLNSSLDNFFNSTKFKLCENPSKLKLTKKFSRRNKLIIDTPKGETKGVDVLSSLLFTRLVFPFANHDSVVNSTFSEESSTSWNFISTSVIKLKNEKPCCELLEYYDCFLKNHVIGLKSLVSRNNSTCNKSFQKYKEAAYASTAISHLWDLVLIFSCPKTNPYIEENDGHLKILSNNVNSFEAGESSSANVPHHSKEEFNSLNVITNILRSLSALSNPKTYPNNYPKSRELEFSLSALYAICIANPEKFLNLIEELPVYPLLNPLQNISAISITLKLLTALCSCKDISFLKHKSDVCVLCLIASLLINIVPHYPENFAVSVTLVQDFLSLVFSIPNFAETLIETSECLSEVLRGVLLSLLKYLEKREIISLSTIIIKKGFLLLHYLSCCIPNFKEKRQVVENEYISLISGMLALSKEDVEFKDFYDFAHSLWDFQLDFTEFDLDDFSEDIQYSNKDLEVDE